MKQKNMPSNNTVIGVVSLIVLVSFLFSLSSCYTEKKAVKQVNKAYVHHPDTLAKIVRTLFPCTTGEVKPGDSTAYKKYLADLQALEDSLKNFQPETITDTVIDTWEDSTKIRVLQSTNSKLKSQIAFKDKSIQGLLKKCRENAPIHDTLMVEDSAKIYTMTRQMSTYEATIKERDLTISDLTKTVKQKQKWLYIFLIAFIISAVVNFIQFRK